MSRKRKTTKKTTRRRRIGSAGLSVTEPAAMIGGAVAGKYLQDMLGDMLTIGGKDYSGAAVLAIGVFLPKIAGKSPVVKSIGNGMIVAGGLSTLKTFVPSLPINGIDQIGYLPQYQAVNGVDEIGSPSIVPPVAADTTDY